jgi:tetratricopeptide (TPR) repeat protein
MDAEEAREETDEKRDTTGRRLLFHWFVVVAALLVVIVGFLLRGGKSWREDEEFRAFNAAAQGTRERDFKGSEKFSRFNYEPGRTPEEIVSSKVRQFGKNRRAIVDRLAAHHQKEIPAEVEQFFEAIEAGNWAEIDRLFQAMAKRSAQYEGSTHDEKLDPFWSAVLETYGAAEQAHLWPAKQLLDYSEAILGSLRPGMVYVGGTDPGRFIPTLVNETSGGEQHVILTQNAFADARYQDYIRFLYGERIKLPEQADVDRTFQEYITDAEKRLEHDQQFPNEPKQIRPREQLQMVDGKMQASGFDAAMNMNERVLQFIVEKNPELSFALEESFPMKSTYEGARPLGPILEVRAGNSDSDADQAGRAVEHWRETVSQLLQNGEAAQSEEVLKTWSKMIVGQANLFAHNRNVNEAEEAYRLALEMLPRNTDAILGLAEYYSNSGRPETAREVVKNFGRRNPDLKADLDRFLPQFK